MRLLIRIISTILFVVSFIIALALYPSKTSAQEILFQDDFNDGNALGWDVIGSPGWNVQNGEYGIHLDPGLSNSVPADNLWNYDWKDIVFEVDLRGVSGTDKNILIKFQDTSNFLEIHHTGGNIYLEKASTQGGAGIIDVVNFPLSNGETYHFKIEIEGIEIRVFVDDVLLFDAEDTEPMFNNWKVGLRAGTGAVRPTEVWYDNVSVTSIGIAPPSPTIGPFELPFDYEGRILSTPLQFKNAFWGRLTAAFDHVLRGGTFRPFTGDTYKHTDCPKDVLGITCYDSHNGTDFSAVGSQNVYSLTAGTVIFTSEHTADTCTPNRGGFGCVVIVEYPDNLFGLFAHLDKIFVNEGNLVNYLTVLAEMGETGCPNCGEHLHLGIMKPLAPISPIGLLMRRGDWEDLLNQVKPGPGRGGYKPACNYKAPNGQTFSFQDPTGWKGLDSDPWASTAKNEGCGVTSSYLWKYDVGLTP